MFPCVRALFVRHVTSELSSPGGGSVGKHFEIMIKRKKIIAWAELNLGLFTTSAFRIWLNCPSHAERTKIKTRATFFFYPNREKRLQIKVGSE